MEIQEGPFTALIPSSNRFERPLILIFGWAGAREAPLRKYAEFLARHGYPSVRSVQPTFNIFSPIERPRRQWAAACLRFVKTHNANPARPLVLYAFSNGGAFVVEQIDKLTQHSPEFSPLRPSILGCIFDSAPGYMHPQMGPRVISAETPPGLRRMATIVGLTAATSLTPLLYGDRAKIYWDKMKRLHLGPALFLYSRDDPLCDAEKLEGLVAAKRALGQAVSFVRWEKSHHCGHLKQHREEYEVEVLGFLKERESAWRAKKGTRSRL